MRLVNIVLILCCLALPRQVRAGEDRVLVPVPGGQGFRSVEASLIETRFGPGSVGRIDDLLVFSRPGKTPAQTLRWTPDGNVPVTKDLYAFLTQRKPGEIILCSWGQPRLYGFFSHAMLVVKDGLLIDVRTDPRWGKGVILFDPADILERLRESYGRLTALEVTAADAGIRTTVARTAPDRLGLPFNILVPRTADWAHYCTQFIWLIYHTASRGEIDLAQDGSYFVIPDHIYLNPNVSPVATWLRSSGETD